MGGYGGGGAGGLHAAGAIGVRKSYYSYVEPADSAEKENPCTKKTIIPNNTRMGNSVHAIDSRHEAGVSPQVDYFGTSRRTTAADIRWRRRCHNHGPPFGDAFAIHIGMTKFAQSIFSLKHLWEDLDTMLLCAAESSSLVESKYPPR